MIRMTPDGKKIDRIELTTAVPMHTARALQDEYRRRQVLRFMLVEATVETGGVVTIGLARILEEDSP